MELVVDWGDVAVPASAVIALERAVRDAVKDGNAAFAGLELRLTHLTTTTRSWLCTARVTFAEGRRAAVEVRGTSPTAAALTAVRALTLPTLQRAS